MTPYSLAKLLHEVYPDEFLRPDYDQPYDDEVCFSKKRKSGDVEITPIRKYWNPLTEPRDLWPLVERFAGDITSRKPPVSDNAGEADFWSTVGILNFWSTITPTSFCTALEEMLKEIVNEN